MSFDPLLSTLGLSAVATPTTPATFGPTATVPAVAVAAAALPSSPTIGSLAVDSGDGNKLKWWNGSSWQSVGGGGGATWSHPIGNPVTLANGAEVSVTHPATTDHSVVVSVFESIAGVVVVFSPQNMSNSTTPSPYVSSESVYYSTDAAWHLFDGSDSTEWNIYPNVGSPPWWAKIDLGSGVSKVLYSYILMGQAAGECPSAWTVQGSNDNAAWTTIDTQSGVSGWSGGTPRTFTLGSVPAGYRYFKLNITANNGAGTMTLRKLVLNEQTSPTIEACTLGNYSSAQQFGVKDENSTTTKVKNLSGSNKTVYIGVMT